MEELGIRRHTLEAIIQNQATRNAVDRELIALTAIEIVKTNTQQASQDALKSYPTALRLQAAAKAACKAKGITSNVLM